MSSRLLVPLIILLCGCSGPTPQDMEAALLLKQVNPADGIDRSEADAIAKAYFLHHVGCGTYESVSDGSNKWIVHGFFGYAGQPIRGFFIDKSTGAVTSSVGPSYSIFSTMLE